MRKSVNSDVGLHHVDAQNADKNCGVSTWPLVGDKVFAKTDERVKEFQMATVIDLNDSDGMIKVRWDSSLDFSWIGRNPRLLQKATPNEKRSRLPVNLYSKGSVRPRKGMISYDERDNDDDIRRGEMDIEEEMSQENIQQEYSQEDNINDAFSSSKVLSSPATKAQNLRAPLDANSEHMSVSSSSTNGRHEIRGEKMVLISEIDGVGFNPPISSATVTKTEVEELNESIVAIEGKIDSDIRNRLRIGLSLLPGAAASSSSSKSGSGSWSGSLVESNSDNSSTHRISSSSSNNNNNNRMVIDSRSSSSSSVSQSPDNIVSGTSPLFYPHMELLRFHSLKEVPNFRGRWTEANESTKVR
jgi:hypothetical protein